MAGFHGLKKIPEKQQHHFSCFDTKKLVLVFHSFLQLASDCRHHYRLPQALQNLSATSPTKNLRVSSQPWGRKAFETDMHGVFKLQVRAHGHLCYLPPAAQAHMHFA